MSGFERADSVSVPAFTRADTAPRGAAPTSIRGPSYGGAGSLRPAPNVMHKPFANIIPALAPAAHIPSYVAPPKTSRPATAGAALTHKTAGVQAASASAAAAAADAGEQSRFKILALETGRLEDSRMQEVERMSMVLRKWGYRERASQSAGSSRDERSTSLKISQNHALRDAVHTEFERFMILAREETARMSAEVKKLFALSMEAAAKLEALDQEEAALMAAAKIRPPNPSAAVEAVALAASGYMGATQSRTSNFSHAPKSPVSQPPPNDQMFGIDYSLAEARTRLAAMDVSSAVASSPLKPQQAPHASSPVTAASSNSVGLSAAVAEGTAPFKATELSAPSVTDVRKDIAAKRRLALQQAMQRQ